MSAQTLFESTYMTEKYLGYISLELHSAEFGNSPIYNNLVLYVFKSIKKTVKEREMGELAAAH